MRKLSKKSFNELEAEWYEKAKGSGFQDIENTDIPDRPLKEWHSRKFCTERSRIRQAQSEAYNKRLDDFLNSKGLHGICVSIARHGNSTVTPRTVKKILELHREGKPQRTIAKKVRRGKKCIHLTLSKAREWMKVA